MSSEKKTYAASDGSREAGGAPDRKRSQLFHAALSKNKRREDLKAADEKLVDKLVELLQDKWSRQECPYCESNDWAVGSELLKIQRLRGDELQPFFGVVCNNCGHTVLIEPDAIELWPEGEDS